MVGRPTKIHPVMLNHMRSPVGAARTAHSLTCVWGNMRRHNGIQRCTTAGVVDTCKQYIRNPQHLNSAMFETIDRDTTGSAHQIANTVCF